MNIIKNLFKYAQNKHNIHKIREINSNKYIRKIHIQVNKNI